MLLLDKKGCVRIHTHIINKNPPPNKMNTKKYKKLSKKELKLFSKLTKILEGKPLKLFIEYDSVRDKVNMELLK